jgi:hypothetical protein
MRATTFAVGGERSAFATAALIAWAAVATLLLVASLAVRLMPAGARAFEGILFVMGDVLQLIAIIAFGAWLHRAYWNLAPLQNASRYAPGMAVAFFFLPFVSLFLPQAILLEIWRKSHRGVDPRQHAPWFELWWYVFLAGSAVFNYAVASSLQSSPATLLLSAAAALAIIAAVMGVQIIRAVDARQRIAFLVKRSQPSLSDEVPSPRRSAIRDVLMPIVAMAEEERLAEPVQQTEVTREPRKKGPSLADLGWRNVLVVTLLFLIQLVSAANAIVFLLPPFRQLDRTAGGLLVLTALLGPTTLAQFILIGIAVAIYRSLPDRAAADEESRTVLHRRLREAKIVWAIALLSALLLPWKIALAAVALANVAVFFAASGGRRLILAAVSARNSAGREAAAESCAAAVPEAGPR